MCCFSANHRRIGIRARLVDKGSWRLDWFFLWAILLQPQLILLFNIITKSPKRILFTPWYGWNNYSFIRHKNVFLLFLWKETRIKIKWIIYAYFCTTLTKIIIQRNQNFVYWWTWQQHEKHLIIYGRILNYKPYLKIRIWELNICSMSCHKSFMTETE